LTTDEIHIELSEDDEIDLNRTVDNNATNKSLLYEGWLEDFQAEKKKQEKNSKKRKRSTSSRSKSRSPTPVSTKNLQYVISEVKGGSRKNSIVINKEESKETVSPAEGTDSEEENKRELEKIKKDIINTLAVKDEPLTIL
jgi:hypothetical protein